MKRILLAAVLALSATLPAVAADAPSVPPMKCEPKPEFPGRLAMQSETRRRGYDRDMKNYKQCVNAYIDERKAAIKANEVAAQAAVDEHNTIMKKIQEEQAAASQQ